MMAWTAQNWTGRCRETESENGKMFLSFFIVWAKTGEKLRRPAKIYADPPKFAQTVMTSLSLLSNGF